MWSFRLGVASFSGMFLGPALAHFEILPPIAGFGIFLLSDTLGMAALSLALSDRWKDPAAPWLMAAALSALPALAMCAFIVRGLSSPRINDVSTDPAGPPRLDAAAAAPANRGRDMSYPAAFVPIVLANYPDIAAIEVQLPAAAAFSRALENARTQPGWVITQADESKGTFEATATSWLFRFRDDVAVRVLARGQGSRIDMRSKSRDGQSDFGANAARIRQFLSALRAS